MSAPPEHACDVDWLFDAPKPNDPAWIARVRAEIAREPVLVKTPKGEFRCRNCGTTEGRNYGHGRCNACCHYWRKHGVERPERFWWTEMAS